MKFSLALIACAALLTVTVSDAKKTSRKATNKRHHTKKGKTRGGASRKAARRSMPTTSDDSDPKCPSWAKSKPLTCGTESMGPIGNTLAPWFTENACPNHDLCYWCGGHWYGNEMGRTVCDDRFKSDMEGACKNNGLSWWKKLACEAETYALYSAVRTMGSSAFVFSSEPRSSWCKNFTSPQDIRDNCTFPTA